VHAPGVYDTCWNYNWFTIMHPVLQMLNLRLAFQYRGVRKRSFR